jgi:predicted transposase/invertase (TIGR01784 family)
VESEEVEMYQQPYDTSMKAMLQEDAPEIVSQFLPGAIFIDALDVEILPAIVRADQVYHILYHDLPHILHLEFQSTSDEEMPERLLQYHVGLLGKHKQPVVSIVIYLFKCVTPISPFRELSGKREILTFYYQVLELWQFDARQYLQKHAMSMYSLLPTMKNADPSLLMQALEELIVYYKDNEAKLLRRVLWFSTLLKHIEKDAKSPSDFEKVRKRLDLFDKLLEENDLVIRQRALGLEEGERKGKKEGEIQSSQQILLDFLQARYPALVEQAEPRITQTTDFDTLRKIIKLLFNTTDEQNAYQVLDALLA